MAYNEKLASRIRDALADIDKVEEKKMFRGLTFMVDGKMCVSVSGEEMMCRFDPSLQESVLNKNGFRTMTMRGKEYKGYGYINQEGITSNNDFMFWIELALDYNKRAIASRKIKK